MDHNYDVLTHVTNKVINQSVIATIIKVVGSSYRKEGTMLLLKSNGENVGILSIGCLEEDLNVQAKRMLETDEIESKIIEYDLSSEDDLGWGRGAGCNGKITILIEKLNEELHSHLKKIKKLLSNGLKVVAIKKLTNIPSRIETKYIIENGDSFGSEVGFQKGNFRDKNTFSHHLLKNIFYVHPFYPRNRLFIFGAGVDARPVATLATKLNFNVFVWDWRTENLVNSHFPSVTILPPSFDWKNIKMTKNDLVMMMTHDFQRDKQLLHHFLTIKHLKYIGILGPRKRTKRLLRGKEIPPHLHSPIGLKIGADGPWEIAISILAEIIENNRKGVSNENELYHMLGGLFRQNDDELVRKVTSND